VKVERFLEINSSAASAASEALAKLTHRPTAVKLLNARLVDPMKERPTVGREDVVMGIYLEITGGVQGAALLCFSEHKAAYLAQTLTGEDAAGSAWV
jgi:chemotaxis protein CheY-P-specific phosphatase CheC